MTESKPVRRLEETDDGLRVVTRHLRDLYDYRAANVLNLEYEDFYTSAVPKKGGPDTIRVGSAAHVGNAAGWQLHGANAIFAEVPLVERELTDAEQAWCDEGLVNRNTESVVEFEIPHPEDLRAAIVDQDLERFDCLDAVIADHKTRHDVLTGLQERIEDEKFRANRLKPREGFPIGLEPEWNPSDDHNDGRSRQSLYDMASMRKDAHLVDFQPIAGFEYHEFWFARARVLEWREPNLEAWDMVALDLVDADGWTYCQECGAVAPEDRFLHVDIERKSVTRRVCDRCADRKAEYDHCVTYTEENVARAQDERAQQNGGQRNLAGKYR